MASVSNNSFGVTVDLSDIRGKLLAIGERLSNAVGRRGLLAGARVIGEEARVRAPQPVRRSRRGKVKGKKLTKDQPGYWATGNLRRSIGWETRGLFRDSTGIPIRSKAVVLVKKSKNRRNARRYASFVEFGTPAHYQGRGAINTVYARSKRKRNLVGGVHPGSTPRPFMRPALDSKAEEAQRVIASVTREELSKEITKLRTQRNVGKGRRIG